jgi:hypothetical protein
MITVYGETEDMVKEMAITYFKVLTHTLPGTTDENHEKLLKRIAGAPFDI